MKRKLLGSTPIVRGKSSGVYTIMYKFLITHLRKNENDFGSLYKRTLVWIAEICMLVRALANSVATINTVIYLSFSPSVYFSPRRTLSRVPIFPPKLLTPNNCCRKHLLIPHYFCSKKCLTPTNVCSNICLTFKIWDPSNWEWPISE